jgi:uncharacterized membrane protein YcgQ (UPF0703/DUF1980 family)
MKLNLKSLLKDKNVLYVVLFIAITNLFAYLMLREFDAIIFFLVVGFLSSYFSKNMIIIMLIAILSTNFLIGTKLLGKAVKEGMATKDNLKDSKDEADKDDKKNTSSTTSVTATPVAESVVKKPSDTIKNKKSSEKFTTLSPASVHEGEDVDHKVDYASTLEAAYDNLDKLLGSDAIRTMTEDTQRLAEKQKLLMGNIKQLQPMMQTASKMLDGLNVGQMGDMLTGLESKFAKFTGSAK